MNLAAPGRHELRNREILPGVAVPHAGTSRPGVTLKHLQCKYYKSVSLASCWRWLRAAVAVAVLAAATGCLVGERYGSSRWVAVAFLSHSGQERVSITYDSPEVLETLEVVDRVLAQERLVRDDPNPLPPDENGSVAFYNISPRYPISCSVALEQSGLAIRFYERYASHSSRPVKGLCAELARELKGHFGFDKVRVQIR
jgi:hypothetical protein